MSLILENSILENRLIEKSNELNIKTNKLMENILNKYFNQNNTFHYKKQSPFKNIKKLDYIYKGEELSNPFKDIDNVVEYSKKLRENSWK